MPAAAFASLAVILAGIWFFGSVMGGEKPIDVDAIPSATALTSVGTPLSGVPDKKYALLLGLRYDAPEAGSGAVSTYRTVLVAPDAGRLQKIADNKGLFMPYGQNFWQISDITGDDGRQTLQAVQRTNKRSKKIEDTVRLPDNVIFERVLFAGNKYLSLQTRVRDDSGRSTDTWRVKRIDQMNAKSADPSAEPHILLRDVVPDLDPALMKTEQWSVSRNPGRWVPELHELSTGDEPMVRLPADVINRDKLSMSWDQIQQLEPAAEDAFTYGNLLGVVVGKQIRVRNIGEGNVVREVLTFPIAVGESVVMIQWAEGSYVEKWIQDMRSLSGK